MREDPPIQILVPTDFSEHSEHAARYAASLGERFGATLHLVHVLSPHGLRGPLSESDLTELEPLLELADRAARQHLDRGAADGEAVAEVKKAVVRGINPWEGLLEYASEHPVDLIVMGMHSGSRLARYLLGSTTERILRFARCPVLVVEKGDRDFLEPRTMAVRLQRIVVADDLSDKTGRALDFVSRWLAPYEPALHMAHAVETEVPAPYVMAGVRSIFELDSELRGRIENMMRKRLSESGLDTWSCATEVEEGPAHEVIPKIAERCAADLMVVAGESHIDLGERIMGGTVERMARRAPCPMLVV